MVKVEKRVRQLKKVALGNKVFRSSRSSRTGVFKNTNVGNRIFASVVNQ